MSSVNNEMQGANAEVIAELSEHGWGAVRRMLALALPTIATMASYTVMQFVDAFMVSQIEPADPIYLSAQGNGGVWAFVPVSIFLGMTGVVNTYVSQHLGAGHPERGPAYAWNALWIGLCMWACLLLPMSFMLPQIFAAIHIDPAVTDPTLAHAQRELVRLESGYAQILLFGGYATMISRGIGQYFYGMHKPGITLTAAVIGNLVNFCFNYTLIHGHFGMPKLGVNGSAIATVIGTTVEAAIPLSVFLSAKYNRLYGTRSAWRPSLAHMRDIIRIGWPPALMFGNELICWAIFLTYLVGHFGPAHNAAGWIVQRYLQLSFMPAVGISFACTAMVGKCLGAGRPDQAMHRAKIGVMIAMAYMGLCAVVFIVFRHQLVQFFVDAKTEPNLAAQEIAIAANIMIIAAVFQMFDGLGITLIGVLRGAGDTVWPGVVTIVLSWTCIVGLGAALAFGVPEWGSMGPWLASAVYIILLGLALLWRFRSGRWKDAKLLSRSAAIAAH